MDRYRILKKKYRYFYLILVLNTYIDISKLSKDLLVNRGELIIAKGKN